MTDRHLKGLCDGCLWWSCRARGFVTNSVISDAVKGFCGAVCVGLLAGRGAARAGAAVSGTKFGLVTNTETSVVRRGRLVAGAGLVPRPRPNGILVGDGRGVVGAGLGVVVAGRSGDGAGRGVERFGRGVVAGVKTGCAGVTGLGRAGRPRWKPRARGLMACLARSRLFWNGRAAPTGSLLSSCFLGGSHVSAQHINTALHFPRKFKSYNK